MAEGETEITADLVHALLLDQHPDLAQLPLRPVEGGWGNQMWRLGDELAVRVQRMDADPRHQLKERRWLPLLAPRLPLLIPGPVRDTDAIRALWQDAVSAPAWPGPPVWVHGDLHPANVVVVDGTFAGVVDFGDLYAGDPAIDLGAAWVLLPAGAADRFFATYAEADEATVRRARGLAVLKSLFLLLMGQNGDRGLPGGKPTWGPAGRAALDRVLSERRSEP